MTFNNIIKLYEEEIFKAATPEEITQRKQELIDNLDMDYYNKVIKYNQVVSELEN